MVVTGLRFLPNPSERCVRQLEAHTHKMLGISWPLPVGHLPGARPLQVRRAYQRTAPAVSQGRISYPNQTLIFCSISYQKHSIFSLESSRSFSGVFLDTIFLIIVPVPSLQQPSACNVTPTSSPEQFLLFCVPSQCWGHRKKMLVGRFRLKCGSFYITGSSFHDLSLSNGIPELNHTHKYAL